MISEIEPVEIQKILNFGLMNIMTGKKNKFTVWNLYQYFNFPEQGEGLPNGVSQKVSLVIEPVLMVATMSGEDYYGTLRMSDEEVWDKIDSGVSYSEVPFGELINFSDGWCDRSQTHKSYIMILLSMKNQ